MEKIIPLLLVTALFKGGSVWSHTFQDSNTYMDVVINNYLKHDLGVDHLDPVTMHDFNTFSKEGVDLAANYTKGVLNGLSSVRRLGNCGTPWYSMGPYSNSTVNCTLTFDLLELKYNVRIKYGYMPKVNAKASAKIKNTDIFIEVTSNPSRNVPSLRQFIVRSLGTFSPKYSGLGPLNSALSRLTPGFSSYGSSNVITLLNDQFQRELAKDVGKIVLPLP